MAKTIKFNLVCNETAIRNLEDLRNNFVIEDVLAYYNNKLLHRWLEVRGYLTELEKVSAITCEESVGIIKELINIFDVVSDEKKVEESVYMLDYLQERRKLCSIYEEQNFKTKTIVDDYETGYRQLVDGILSNPDDVARIKANIAEMAENYKWVLEMNHRSLFYTLKEKSALAVMCLLMNEDLRKYYLPIEIRTEDDTVIWDVGTNTDKAAIYTEICNMVRTSEFRESLGDNLLSFAGQTEGYWKDLEPKGKKYMIIYIAKGCFVRSAGVTGGDLSSDDVVNEFVIVDGIDYKSNDARQQIRYMEV